MNKIVVLLLLVVPCFSQSLSPSEFVARALPGFAKSNNEILNQEASIDSVITSYNNNHFNNDDHVSFLTGEHLPINNGDGLAEGKIIWNGKSANFGNNHLLNGLFRDVSKILNFHCLIFIFITLI